VYILKYGYWYALTIVVFILLIDNVIATVSSDRSIHSNTIPAQLNTHKKPFTCTCVRERERGYAVKFLIIS